MFNDYLFNLAGSHPHTKKIREKKHTKIHQIFAPKDLTHKIKSILLVLFISAISSDEVLDYEFNTKDQVRGEHAMENKKCDGRHQCCPVFFVQDLKNSLVSTVSNSRKGRVMLCITLEMVISILSNVTWGTENLA